MRLVESSALDRKLRSLTAKQRAVLDLLIQHKTSKEIARILGISHYTVDQRIAAARKKMGVTSRNELAASYRRISNIAENVSQGTVYGFPHVELPAEDRDQSARATGKLDDTADDNDSMNLTLDVPGERLVRVAPEIIEGRYGTFFRLAAIGLLTILLLLIALGGLAAFGQLLDLLSSSDLETLRN